VHHASNTFYVVSHDWFMLFFLFSEKKIVLTLSVRLFVCQKVFSLVQPASESTHFN